MGLYVCAVSYPLNPVWAEIYGSFIMIGDDIISLRKRHASFRARVPSSAYFSHACLKYILPSLPSYSWVKSIFHVPNISLIELIALLLVTTCWSSAESSSLSVDLVEYESNTDSTYCLSNWDEWVFAFRDKYTIKGSVLVVVGLLLFFLYFNFSNSIFIAN